MFARLARPLFVFIVVTAGAGAALAEQPRWAPPFTPESAGLLVPGRYLAVGVVGRGAPSAELALDVQRLRETVCGTAYCVVADLPSVTEASSDQDVISAASRAGLDAIMMLRLDAAVAGGPRLWVDVIRSDGVAIDHFGAADGEYFQRWHAADSGAFVAASSLDVGIAASLIRFANAGSRGSLEDLVPYQNTTAAGALGPTAFYDLVGRSDLSERFRSRRSRKRVLSGLGVSLLGAGGAGMLGSVVALNYYVFSERGQMAFGISGGVAAVGLGLLIAGALQQPHGVSTTEALRMANDWNARQLGGRSVLRNSYLTPYLDSRGGGMALAGAF